MAILPRRPSRDRVIADVGLAVAIGSYVLFEVTPRFMISTEESTRRREEEWLRRLGNPARLDLEVTEGGVGTALIETVKAMKPGTDLVVMMYFDRDGGRT